MIQLQLKADGTGLLAWTAIEEGLRSFLAGRFAGAKLLVLIPDLTRTIPLPQLFPIVIDALRDTKQLDFMVALGTHPPLSLEQMYRLVGINAEQRGSVYRHVGLLNHVWNRDDALRQIGTITQDQIKDFAGEAWHPTLVGDVPIRINRTALEYDHILILGPTFPHEVIGFSGGSKYLFPGISGPEMISVTHWLAALVTILNTIGIKDTPVRRMVDEAAKRVPVPVTLIGLTVVGDGLAGVVGGDLFDAWSAAADLSSKHHIRWVDQPYQRALSVAPPMYDELWTAGKAMYKLEPAIADGGEIIIHAPHLDTISVVHGEYIEQAGYHVLDYFLKQWDKFGHLPLGVLAHGSHVRGGGTFENGVECARIQVTLASRIPKETCERLGLGYADPDTIDPSEWQGREGDGVLYVPKAGEILYRVRS